MKSRNLLTHGAAFCIGGSLLWLVPRDAPVTTAGGETDGRVPTRGTARGAAAGFSADDSADGRGTRGRAAATRRLDSAGAAAALDDIIRMGDPLDRQAALLDIVSRLAPGDFADFARQHRESNHFVDSGGEYEIILRAWAKADPLGALDDATARGSDRDTHTLLSAWAGRDASAAEQWALSHHEGDGPNRHLTAVIRGLAGHDVNRAAELSATLPRSRERGRAMEAVTQALFMQGTEVAMGFPGTIEDPAIRAGYVWMISERLAGKDPEAAAAWLSTFPDGETQQRGARSIASALARQDTSEAARWVRTLDPAAQAEAARGVIVPMSDGNIQDTARWVSQLSGIPGYDGVIEEFVWSCDVRDPEQSAAWIEAISDEAQKARLYHRMLGGWSNRDADAVRDWVAAHEADLPNSVRNRFRRR